VDFEVLGHIHRGDADKGAADEDVELGRLAFGIGQTGHFDLRALVEPQIVAEPELDLQAAGLRTQLIALDDDQVDLALLEALILGSLHIDVALDEAHARVAALVVRRWPGRARRAAEGPSSRQP